MKLLTRRQLILLLILFIFGALVRFWNFDTRMTFGPEQAISVINSAEKIDHFTLLGMPYLQRQTSTGFNLWHAPFFPYSLIPFQLLFDYNPYPLTVYFVFLNLFTAFAIFYLIFKMTRIFLVSFMATFFFLFDPYMIHHSLFIWIVNYFPLLGILTFYLLIGLLLNHKKWHGLLLGLLTGLGVGLDLAYLTIIPFIVFVLLIAKNRLRNLILFVLGGVVANLPTIIFDLRHDYFHLRIFYQFFLDYQNGLVSPLITYYHFLHFFPIYFVFLAVVVTLIAYLSRKIWLVSAVVVFFYLFALNLSPYWNKDHSIGMPEGLTYKTYEQAAKAIKNDDPQTPFNLATLHDFDTRAHPLRYLVKYVYKSTPQDTITYQGLNTLYVLAPKNYDLDNPQVWELQVHLPYRVTNLADYGNFKLVKLSQ